MTKLEKRAIKITELSEELEEAKNIIREFVWPSDCNIEQYQKFQQRAARFAGTTVPIFKNGKQESL
jgi:hypothetical protein